MYNSEGMHCQSGSGTVQRSVHCQSGASMLVRGLPAHVTCYFQLLQFTLVCRKQGHTPSVFLRISVVVETSLFVCVCGVGKPCK